MRAASDDEFASIDQDFLPQRIALPPSGAARATSVSAEQPVPLHLGYDASNKTQRKKSDASADRRCHGVEGHRCPAFSGQAAGGWRAVAAVAPQSETVASGGTERIDATGKFLMPGIVEGHAHLSFVDTRRGTAPGELPPEDHALLTMDAARKLLTAGFTSACSAAAAKIRLDVAVRDGIVQGMIDGPHLHLHQESFGVTVDGSDEVRRMRGWKACAATTARRAESISSG